VSLKAETEGGLSCFDTGPAETEGDLSCIHTGPISLCVTSV
jgi:hypothetical protein